MSNARWVVKDMKILEVQGPGPVSLQDVVEGNPEAFFRRTPDSVVLANGWQLHGTEFLGPGPKIPYLMSKEGEFDLVPITVVHNEEGSLPGNRLTPRKEGTYYKGSCSGTSIAQRLERFDPRFLHHPMWPDEIVTVAYADLDGRLFISSGPPGRMGFVLC